MSDHLPRLSSLDWVSPSSFSLVPSAESSILYVNFMADTARAFPLQAAVPTAAKSPRHTAVVRLTHWLTTLCFFALLLSGFEVVVSHPRFYWGEDGNVGTPALFSLPIPASRSAVRTGYGYVLPDQNGWSRALHFQAAWISILTGLLYVVYGALTGHFRRNLLPARADLSWRTLVQAVGNHLRFKRPDESEAWAYNILQRLTYLVVIFVLFPLVIWTGLAMSPGFVAAFPFVVTVLGGQQSARTLHFFTTIVLVMFLLVHVVMISSAGFRKRTSAMITGQVSAPKGER